MTIRWANLGCGMGMEGPPGRPEVWVCRHCGARVSNRQAVCPQCKKSR